MGCMQSMAYGDQILVFRPLKLQGGISRPDDVKGRQHLARQAEVVISSSFPFG